MRGTVAACILFAALLSGMIFAQSALEKVGKEMGDSIEKLSAAIEDDEWEEADRLTLTLREEWKSNAVWLAMLIDHAETDIIITTISSLSQYEKYREVPELMAEVETLRELIEHIPKKERPTSDNIL